MKIISNKQHRVKVNGRFVSVYEFYYLYYLKCKNKIFYVGITWNPEYRIKQHTIKRNYKSFDMVIYKKYKTLTDACIAEKNLIKKLKTFYKLENKV